MKPTTFMQNRYRAAMADRKIEIAYAPYIDYAGNVDSHTAEVRSHDDAYSKTYAIPALVDLTPSPQKREKFGIEGNDGIVVAVAIAEFDGMGVTPKIGDCVDTPDIQGHRYVEKKPTYHKQVEGKYLEVRFACVRKEGWE